MSGRFLTLADEEFNYNVDKDIRTFIERHPHNSVLIFPPVNNFRRFLIHKTCETISNLHDIVTFSIGQGIERRTVVCFKKQLIDKSILKSERQNNWRQENFEDTSRTRTKSFEPKIMGVTYGENDASASTSKGTRLNSIPIYRPPQIRKSLSLESTTNDDVANTSNLINSTNYNNINNNSNNNNIKLNELQKQPNTTLIKKNSTTVPVTTTTTTSTLSSTQRQRRPDRAVYSCPRARRSSRPITPPPPPTSSSTIEPIINDITESTESIKPTNQLENLNNTNKINDSKIKLNNKNCDDIIDQTILMNGNNCLKKEENHIKKNCINEQELIDKMSKNNEVKKSLRIEDANGIAEKDSTKEDKEEIELRKASQEINRSNRRIIKQTFRSDVLEIEPQSKAISSHEQTKDSQRTINPEIEDWDTMFDDNGDCLDPKLINELTSAVGQVTIEKPKFDYKDYEAKQAILNDEEFPHVLEVSNFPVEFKTQDLMRVFSEYKESGFDFKWVDDTHALAVFSSSRIAAEVLASTSNPFVHLKPLAEASVESRNKAKKCASSLQPYRSRPETCAALARRLVTGALGVRLKTAREELENERKVLREAKERKLLAAKQRQEMWEG